MLDKKAQLTRMFEAQVDAELRTRGVSKEDYPPREYWVEAIRSAVDEYYLRIIREAADTIQYVIDGLKLETESQQRRERDQEWRTSSKQEANFNWS